MSVNRAVITLRHTVREVLAVSQRETERLSPRQAEDTLRTAAGRDYAKRLRRLFDRQQLSEIIAEFSKVLPTLNVEVLGERDPRRFARIAATLGAGFTAVPFDKQSGLRGFYIRQGETVRKPLICVNSATHPVVLASSFWHELGHHLTARLFDDHRHKLNLSFSSNYHRHLEDPLEAAADLVSILAAYPNSAANQLFAPWLKHGSAPNANSLLAALRPHLRSICGFDFEGRFSAVQNLRYLAAMIHFGKLRWALLAEFGI